MLTLTAAAALFVVRTTNLESAAPIDLTMDQQRFSEPADSEEPMAAFVPEQMAAPAAPRPAASAPVTTATPTTESAERNEAQSEEGPAHQLANRAHEPLQLQVQA